MRKLTDLCRFFAVVALLCAFTATMCPAANKKKVLEPDDYKKVLLKFVEAVEEGKHQGLWGKIRDYFKGDSVIGSSHALLELIKEREWSGKKVYECELVAYRQVGDYVNQAYVLVLTDRGVYCWKFELYMLKNDWYIGSYTIKKGVDMIAGGYEMHHLLTGKKSDVVKVETVAPGVTTSKDITGEE